MPHQCVHCSKVYPVATKALIEGCDNCRGHFFFYIRDEQLEKARETPVEIPQNEKSKVEKDIREIAGIQDPNAPVILDIESVRVLGEGKYEIDIVNLFNKSKPVIYRMDEGKYIIDLSSIVRRKSNEED